MLKVVLVISLIMGGCVQVSVYEKEGYQDMRDPSVRASVEEIKEQTYAENYNPLNGPPKYREKDETAYDIPLPKDSEGRSCDEPPLPNEPKQGGQKSLGPTIKIPEVYQAIRNNAIEGLPPWYDDLKLLECNIEAPLTKEMVRGWGKHPTLNVWLIGYDRNGDKKVDANVEIREDSPYPKYYSFDRGFDGHTNIIYEDTLQDGTCKGIMVNDSQPDVVNPKGEA